MAKFGVNNISANLSVDTGCREAVTKRKGCGATFEAGELAAEAKMRASREAKMAGAIGPCQVSAAWLREDCGVTIGGNDHAIYGFVGCKLPFCANEVPRCQLNGGKPAHTFLDGVVDSVRPQHAMMERR